jgi:hypothetical protein
VVAGSEVVAASRYRTHGQEDVAAGVPQEVEQYAAELLGRIDWRPDAVFILDVCEAKDGLHVLELNAFSCSGLYGCDTGALVDRVNRVALAEWSASWEDNCRSI